MKPQQDDVLSRLDKLESENKVLRMAAVLLVLSVLVLLLLGAAQTAQRTVTGSEFLLQDDQGHTRARLSVDSNKNVALVFLDGSGQKQMSLTGSDDKQGRRHASLALGEGAVDARYVLAGTDKDDWATISDGGVFLAGKGTDRIVLSASGPTSPSIEVADSQGFASEIGVTSTESPTGKTQKSSAASLVLIGKDQSVLWTAP
jgi:hypothetical protein